MNPIDYSILVTWEKESELQRQNPSAHRRDLLSRFLGGKGEAHGESACRESSRGPRSIFQMHPCSEARRDTEQVCP